MRTQNGQVPATAVVVDDRAYLIDAGPGIVRRAALAAREKDILCPFSVGPQPCLHYPPAFGSYCWSSGFAL